MKNSLPMLLAVTTLTAPQIARAYAPEPVCAVPSATLAPHGGGSAEGTQCVWRPPLGTLRSGWSELCIPDQGEDGGSFENRIAAAQHAMAEARARLREGDQGQALLHLRVVAAALPEIEDHVAMLEGEALEAQGLPDRAAERYYQAALVTPSADLRALARVARARTLLEAGDRDGAKVAMDLIRRYPELPELTQIRLLVGQLREQQGLLGSAINFYRSLDLQHPGFPAAAEARARLEALKARKVWVAPYTPEQQVARAETLVSTGPVELAREAVDALKGKPLSALFAPRVAAMEARLALVEGRFDDARDHARKSAEAGAEPAPLEQERTARLRVRNLLRGRPPNKVIPIHVLAALEMSSRAGVTDLTDELLGSLTERASHVSAKLRFDALATAAGTASEPALIALAETLVHDRTYGTAARYHRARALERNGEPYLARIAFEQLVAEDEDGDGFYAILSDQRLRALDSEPLSDPCYTLEAPLARCKDERPSATALDGEFRADVQAALARLKPLAREHGEAFPWLPRAEALLQLGETTRAADELHESYLAWRSAMGWAPLRAGTDAVYRGQATGRIPQNWQVRAARRKLFAKDRAELAGVAASLGDFGTAVLLGGRKWVDPLPRPFHDEVEAAAARHGVDPDLLWAVMRVESVYNNRIISYAGAVGLMQIMPRTGRLIANAMGRSALTTTDLLRPEINIDFAAWYLRSLIERMDGRVPLAIASYNGGPHNVRKWIHRYGEHQPLDAFLERIPFTQTHRYVRRVLGYYAQYRAQRGEKLARMPFDLPEERVDVVAF